MDCTCARELLSAELDGEAPTVDTPLAHAHRAGCAACERWAGQARDLQGLLRVREAEVVPDVRAAVFTRFRGRAGRRRVRAVVAVLAAVEFLLAMSSLAFGYGQGSAHDARHLGSFTVAVAFGLVYAAWRPSRSTGVLVVVAALVLAMTTSAVVELAEGRTTWIAELHHVLELSALGSLWALAGFPRPTIRRLWRPVTHRALRDDR